MDTFSLKLKQYKLDRTLVTALHFTQNNHNGSIYLFWDTNLTFSGLCSNNVINCHYYLLSNSLQGQWQQAELKNG